MQGDVQKKSMSRRALENGFSTISVMIMLLLLAVGTGFLIFFPRSTQSVIEKRDLTSFPNFSFASYFSGDFTSGINDWYTDTVPYRDSFKNMGNNIKGLFGISSTDTAVVVGNPVKKVNSSSETTSSAATDESSKSDSSAANAEVNSSTESSTEESSEAQKDFRQEEAEGSYDNGMLIINQDGHWRGLELFGGGSGTNYISSLNELNEQLGGKVKIYSMPAPLASEFYTPSNYSDYSASQEDCFNSIASQLDSSITSVDCTSVLRQHTEEPIYCRTDHHWQGLGAYYAAQTFAKAAGVDFADISKYNKVDTEGYVGSLYSFSGSAELLNDPETFTYYEPTAEYTTYYYDQSFNYQGSWGLLVDVDIDNSYLRYLGGDGYVVKIKTSVNNGRKLLVIKDSYGNAEIPFYTRSFEEIYVIDVRYFERNLVNFINTTGVTDVLFTMSAYSVVGENADNIAVLMSQDAESTIVDEQAYKKEDAT